MQRIAINRSIGGFGISTKAFLWLIEHGSEAARSDWELMAESRAETQKIYGDDWRPDWHVSPLEPNDPLLLQCLDELGQAAWGEGREIKIVEIPDGVEWDIGESEEGYQWVYEKHRIWV